MTHDEKMIVARADRQVVFFDVEKLIAGSGNAVLGALGDEHFFSNGEMAITADDKYLFAGQGRNFWITVIDLGKARSGAFGPAAIVGGIPIDAKTAPFFLVLSPDERFLYATGHPPQGSPAWNPNPLRGCEIEPNNGLLVIDVLRARSNPGASAVVAAVNIDCAERTPGVPQLATSPDGNAIYMTLPRANALLAFDTQGGMGLAPRLIGRVPVGRAPRAVVTIDGGRKIVVANSDFISGTSVDSSSSLTVIDAARVAAGAGAVLGTIPAGAAPNDMMVTHDGRTLLVANWNSQTVQIIDLNRVTLEPVGRDVK